MTRVKDFHGSSAAPLRLATWLGMASFCFCLFMILFSVVVYANGATVPGWTSLFVAVLFLGGLQLFCLGLLGECVARIYSTVPGRPTHHIGYDSGVAGLPTVGAGSRADSWPSGSPDLDVASRRIRITPDDTGRYSL
jgi:polyisoprenyl-phosphate glycosyltransferase